MHNFLSGTFPIADSGFRFHEAYVTASFINFISPFYRDSYVNYIIRLFQRGKKTKADPIINNTAFLTTDDKMAAYTTLGEYLEKNNRKINEFKIIMSFTKS